MAQRRMISPDVTETDAFLDMSGDAQSLYFHLNMYADDDGLISNPKSIRRMMGANEDDLKALVNKGYLILFSDGVVAITHWRIHNTIRKDRYKPSIHTEDVNQLALTDSNIYYLDNRGDANSQPSDNQLPLHRIPTGDQVTTNGIPTDNQPVTGEGNKDNRTSSKNADKSYCDGPATNGIPTGNQSATNGKPRLSKVKLSKISLSKDNLNTTSTTLNLYYDSLENQKFKDELKLLVSEYGNDVVAFAINSMYEEADRPTFAYLRKILNRYKEQGLDSLSAVQHDDDVYHGKVVETVENKPCIPIYKLGE